MIVSVITVTYNSASYIAEQILSVISSCEGVSFEHIIVDNASTDGTVEIVRPFGHVTLIKNKKNLGFGKANNLGFERSTGDYILLFNPDMKQITDLTPAIDKLVSDETIGILGAKLLDQQGELNPRATPRRFPKLSDQLAVLTKMAKLFPRSIDRYMMNSVQFDHEMDVDSVQGSWMLMRRKTAERVGELFDERFHIWFEDVDLCRRTQEAGYRVVWDPTQQAIDVGGQSFAQRNLLWKQWNFLESMVKYFFKWGI